VVTWQENRHFVPLSVFYSQSAVGMPHLVRSPRFIPESVFYTQSVVRSPVLCPSLDCSGQEWKIKVPYEKTREISSGFMVDN